MRPHDSDSDDDDEKFIDNLSTDVAKDTNLYVGDLNKMLNRSTPDIKGAIDNVLAKDQIAWGYKLFPFDLIYAGIKQENSALQIYKIDDYSKPQDCTMADFLKVKMTDDFWKEELKKYTKTKDNTNTIFALGLKCNSYYLSVNGLIPSIKKQSLPFWTTVSLDGNHAEFQVLFGKIQLINEHVWIKKCRGSISLSSISIKGAVYVFGLTLHGELALTNGFAGKLEEQSLEASAKLSLKVYTAKKQTLSFSDILNHWKKHFKAFAPLFDVLGVVFCINEARIAKFKCELSAGIGMTLLQTESGKSTEKENEDKKRKEAEDEGKEYKAPPPIKYAIDLSFQPQINPDGAIGTIFKILGIDQSMEALQEMFPLELYLKGDNADGLAIGAKIESFIPLKTDLFGIIYFDGIRWMGGIEYKTDDSSVTLKTSATLSGMIKIGIEGLEQILTTVSIGAEVSLTDPTSAEISLGWCIKFGDEKGWDPFSLVGLDSGFKLQTLSMGMSLNLKCEIGIMCATTFNFLGVDVVIAIKFVILVEAEVAYPKAFHFEQKGVWGLREVFEALCPLADFGFDINKIPNIQVKNCMFSGTLETKTEFVVGIEWKADDEDDEDNGDDETSKAIAMADALNNLDKYHMENKVLTINQGLVMKGEMNICDVITIQGELAMSLTSFKMRVHFLAEEEKMEQFKKDIWNKIKECMDAFEYETFGDDGYDDECDNDSFFEKALNWGWKVVKLIGKKIFQMVKAVVKFIMDNISIYEFLYHLQVSLDALPVFKFKLNMRIGDVRIKIDIDTERDFTVKNFFKKLIDLEYWVKLIATITAKAWEILGSLAKKILNFLWENCGGELIYNWLTGRTAEVIAIENEAKAIDEKRRQIEEETAEMRQRMIEETKEFVTDEISKYTLSIKTMSDDRDRLGLVVPQLKQRLDHIDAELDAEIAKVKSRLEAMDDEVKVAEKQYKQYDDKIKTAINKTSQDESLVCKFLKILNDGLLFALTQNTESRNALSTKMKIFNDSLLQDAESEYQVTIQEWFVSSNLSRLVPILDTIDDYTLMEDIVDDYDGFSGELYSAIEATNGSIDHLTEDEKVRIEAWCVQETADETWMKYQKEKQQSIKDKLLQTIPILSEYLDHVVDVTSTISELLSYEWPLNDKQTEAVKNIKENKKKWMKLHDHPDIDFKDDDEKKDESNKQYLREKQLSDIDDIDNIKQTCDAIEFAAKIKLSFVEALRDNIDEDIDPLHRESALQMASTIEYCCCEMIEKQCMVRKSVFLARRLIDFKPEKITSAAKPLWDVITDGIKDTYTNAIDMAKVSMEFFSLFEKLNISGFYHFNSVFEQEPDAPLQLALEYVDQYMTQFIEFGEEKYDPVMDKLKTSAQDMVTSCIKKSKACGGDSASIANTMKQRENAETLYLEKRKAFTSTRFEFGDKYHELRAEYTNVRGQYEAKSWRFQYLEDTIWKQQQYLNKLESDESNTD